MGWTAVPGFLSWARRALLTWHGHGSPYKSRCPETSKDVRRGPNKATGKYTGLLEALAGLSGSRAPMFKAQHDAATSEPLSSVTLLSRALRAHELLHLPHRVQLRTLR